MSCHYQKSLVAHAVLYIERFGCSVIPISKSKVPSVPWSEFMSRVPKVSEVIGWDMERLGIVTGQVSGIVVVDCDSREHAEWFWDNISQSNVVVRSRRGFHFYFKHPGERVMNAVKVAGHYDVRGDGGYVVAPPSRHADGEYEWVKPLVNTKELPVFNPAWRPVTVGTANERTIRDGLKYIMQITANSGQGGHNDTFRAVKTLFESGLDSAGALLAIQTWNKTNAKPPWSDRELLHKVQSVYGGQRTGGGVV